MKRIIVSGLTVSLIVLLTGCVTGRRVVTLTVPAAVAPASTKGDIRIGAVADHRIFVNKPSDPSVPSVNGDVDSITAEQKNTMIGRQRNGFGKAMGDIALSAGDTVTQRVRLLVEQGLQQRGYRISNDASTADYVDISIDKFWAWGTPGMWSVSFEARVNCQLTIKRGDRVKSFVVDGYGMNHGQVAKNANWQLAYDRAFKDFATNLAAALANAGF